MTVRGFVQTFTFDKGIIDAELLGRRDIRAYPGGCTAATNMIGVVGGPMARRGGFAFVGERADAAAGARLARFEFKQEQVYLLVFSDLKVHVYKDDELQTGAGVTSAFSAVQVAEMDWDQSLDTMLLTHEDVASQKLERQGSHTAWAMSALTFTKPPTYPFDGDTTGTATPSATTGSITITSTANDFASASVGDTVRINNGKAEITTVTSDTVVAATVKENLDNTDAAEPGDWSVEEPVWSASRGYPGTVHLSEGRSIWGGSKELLQSVWTSFAGRPFHFETTKDALDDEAVEAALEGSQVNAVRYITSLGDQFFLTSGGIFVNEVASDKPVTPTNFLPQKDIDVGTARIRPVDRDGAVVMVAADGVGSGVGCGEIVFDTNEESYIYGDLNVLAASVMRGPVDMAARKADGERTANHIFVVNANGTIAVHHSLRRQQVSGWTLWESKGNSGTDVALRTAVTGNEPYFLMKRTINGATKYFIEKHDPARKFDSSVARAAALTITGATQANPVVITAANDLADGETVFINGVVGMTELNGRSFAVANAAATTFELTAEDGSGHTAYASGGTVTYLSLAGLDHLDGETVKVFADGGLRDDATVSGGQILIKDGGEAVNVSAVEAGLRFYWELEPLPIEAQIKEGTLVGEKHRLIAATVQLNNALPGITVNGRELAFRGFGGFTTDSAPTPFTGQKKVRFLGWNSGEGATVKIRGFLPATVLSVVAEIGQ